MNNNYEFRSRTKAILIALMVIGVFTMIAGLFPADHAPEAVEAAGHGHEAVADAHVTTHDAHGAVTENAHGEGHGHEGGHGNTRFWANLLVNAYFYLGIALLATFFMMLQYVTETAWSVVVKRVFEAVSAYLPYAAVVIVIVLLAGQFGVHHLYHWMDPSVLDPESEHFDQIIKNKHAYFGAGNWFFWLRTVLYLVVWVLFQRAFIKRSDLQDEQGGTEIHYTQMAKAAIFIVFFAYTSSASSWDWMMSLDVHWFSTMYGWYSFAGMFISALITITLLTVYLKRRGYLEQVNESHIHDLGKWVFACSLLWTYLYFCQFLLIWYTNIPEETIYYQERLHDFGYMALLWTVFFMNFLFPIILLMSRDSKRNFGFLVFVGSIIFVGHWLDVFMMVMPATVKGDWHLGWMEIGMGLGFLGFMLYIVHAALAKRPLIVKEHPYLEESINHHV